MRRIIFTSFDVDLHDPCSLHFFCNDHTPIFCTTSKSKSSATEATMSLTLTSDAFANGQSIPAKYSCVGKNISPALAWNDPPAGTQSFALIVDDPDAPMGTWVHWVLFNIPANTHSLQENMDHQSQCLLARIHRATCATMVLVRRAEPIGITSNSMRSIPRSAFRPGRRKSRSLMPPRVTSLPRAN